jgi:Methyltransferase domain
MFEVLDLSWFKKLRGLRKPPRSLAQDLGSVATTSAAEETVEYGRCWKASTANLSWYTWMYGTRIQQHHAFQIWFRSIHQTEKIASVLEFGCGMAVGYADFFSEHRYTGVDLGPEQVRWCQENRVNPKHDYLSCDFIRELFSERYDLVFSQGTIDNTYDMDEFLRAAVRASRRWVFITAYRGFFPDLTEHRIEWRPSDGCYYNDLSVARATSVLRDAGCAEVAILPASTGNKDIPYETLILARVGEAKRAA